MFAGIGGFRAGLTARAVFSVSDTVRSTSMPTPVTAPSMTFERRSDTIQTPEPSTQTTCRTSNCCAEDSPARHFLTLAAAGDLPTPEALSSLKLPGWLKPNDLGICLLRMFPAFYRTTMGKPLRSSSPHWGTWGIMSNGLCLTASILESPNPGNGCSLSVILIPDAPEKYFLSPAAMEKLLYSSSAAPKDTGSMTRQE